MSTLKSPLLRGSDAPRVHPRLRKCRSRCTLDCGFKTSESPALRGFVGGLRALATAALYLVLKSNGLHHSKNLPVKFGFSSKSVPANIAKKLPLQLRPKPLYIAFFNFSHKWPTFAFVHESGYTLGFRRKIAHKGTHAETGAFSPSATAGLCVASEIAPITTFATLDSATLLYTYISRFSVNPNYQQREKIRQSCRRNSAPNRFSSRFSTSRTNAPRLLSRVKAGTPSAFGERLHTTAYTPKQGRFGRGTIITLGAFRTFANLPGSGIRTACFAAFGSWPAVLPKNAESLRSSDALMRVAAPRRRGPTGLRDLFLLLSKLWLYALCLGCI